MTGGGAGEPCLIHRVIGRLNVGGPAMHVVNLARALEPHGFRTRLLAGSVSETEGDMEWYARERGVEVTTVPELGRAVRPGADVAAFLRLLSWFRRERPRIVHTHTAKAGALGRAAAVAAGVPVRIHTFHGHVLGGAYFGPRITSAYRSVERHLARLTHRIVVLSEAQQVELSRELDIAPASRFRVIPLGLELDRFTDLDRGARRGPVRRSLGIEADARVIGIVGRLVPIKNHPLLFKAVKMLEHRLDAPLRILVVGGGGEEAELRDFSRALGLGEHVRWLGWRDDLPDLHAAMDVMALSSTDEGTPVAVIEAGAAGTPVVATAVGGVPDVMASGVVGRLVPAHDPGAFAEALHDMLRGEAVGAEDARNRVAERYAVSRLALDTADLYTREMRRVGESRR